MCSGSSPAPAFDSVINHNPHDSKIDTVVVVMMENRSFDHYLGWLADDEQYLEAGRRRYGKKFHVRGKNQVEYRDPKGLESPEGHGKRWWLTKRDRHAQNIGRVLGLETPDPDLGFDIDLELPTFAGTCAPTPLGEAIGWPGDSPLSEKLQALTAARFPDAEARPWIETPAGEQPFTPS